MKKLLFGIFAHPDDEAFGPSGTLLKAVRSGIDVHLLCATNGQSGVNQDHTSDLGKIRLVEWRKAGRLIGASSQNYLGYHDGELCNNIFHDIAQKVEQCVRDIIKSYPDHKFEVTFMTFDLNGLSGHIDHVVMSMVASYVYYNLQSELSTQIHFKELRYFCLSKADFPTHDTGFVFMPAGRKPAEIDITVDIEDIAEAKREIIHAHYSQRQDAEMLLRRAFVLEREHFYLAK